MIPQAPQFQGEGSGTLQVLSKDGKTLVCPVKHTVVGPRFNPGSTATGKTGMGFSPDTDAVPDGSKITPHVPPLGVRAGHDISINVAINAAVPIHDVISKLHQVKVENQDSDHANV